MRKVLYISLYTGMGGGEVSLLNLMSHLDPARYIPILLVPDDGPLTQQARKLGIETIVEPFPVFPLRDLIKPHSFGALMRAGVRVRRRIGLVDPDVIQCSDVLSLLLLLPSLVRKRLTIIFSMIFFYEPARIFLLWLLDTMFVSRIVTCSKAVQEHLLNHLPALKQEALVIYNGVDSGRFVPLDRAARTKCRERFGIPPNAKVAGLVARFDTWKGHLTFLRALEILRNQSGHTPVLGLIAGGAFTGATVREVREYYDSVMSAAAPLVKEGSLIILDHTDEVELLTGCLDALVCPSDREAYGLVVLEAFAAGVPVVATDTVGALEVLPDSPHLHICTPGDPASLAKSIRNAVTKGPDSAEQTAMGTTVKALNWESFSAQFSSVYDEVCEET